MRLDVLTHPSQLHRHAQTRKRRSQLMRDVEQQPPLGRHQHLNSIRHLVERSRKPADFVATVHARARREVSSPEAIHGLLQLAHGIGEVARKAIAEQRQYEQNRQVNFRLQEPRDKVSAL